MMILAESRPHVFLLPFAEDPGTAPSGCVKFIILLSVIFCGVEFQCFSVAECRNELIFYLFDRQASLLILKNKFNVNFFF